MFCFLDFQSVEERDLSEENEIDMQGRRWQQLMCVFCISEFQYFCIFAFQNFRIYAFQNFSISVFQNFCNEIDKQGQRRGAANGNKSPL